MYSFIDKGGKLSLMVKKRFLTNLFKSNLKKTLLSILKTTRS